MTLTRRSLCPMYSWIQIYMRQVLALLAEDSPSLWNRLLKGEFAVTKNPIPFTSIGTDQAQEHDNKILKGEGGLKGITNKPTGLLKYCLAAPVLGRLAMETQEMFGANNTSATHQHHQDPPAKVTRQERSVHILKDVIEPHKVLSGQGKLHNFMTQKVLREEAQSSILNMGGR